MTGDEMRDQLAAAVAVAMDAAYDYSSYRWPQQEDCPRIADVLLPVVRKIVADELRAAADVAHDEYSGWEAANVVRARADALDPQ